MGGHTNKVNQSPDYTGVQLQTAAMSLPVPLAWGLTRVAPNLIWYNNFQTHKKAVGKGGVTGKQYNYTYSADVILALCEGPITGISKTYVNQGYYTGFSTGGFTLFLGTTPQTPWSYLTAHYPADALSYQGIAYLAQANYNLGQSESLPSTSFEVEAPLYMTGVGGTIPDADPALLAYDFLTNDQYGANFPTTRIDTTSLYSSGSATTTGDSTYQTYCRAMGFGLSPAIQNQETGITILSRWMQITNTAAVWTGYSLKFVPYGDETVTANGVTYIPPTAQVFSFGDDDYIQDGMTDPVIQNRRDWFDAFNAIAIECRIREYEYNMVPIDWIDQSQTELLMRRQASPIQAHEVCETAMATNIVSLIGQRMVYIRNTFTATFGPEYSIYEPMDVGIINDSAAGIVDQPVRIQSIDEDDKGILTFVFEEFPGTVGSPTTATSGGPGATLINSQVAPDSVNAPLIFEPNSVAAQFLVGSSAPVVGIAVSGGSGGVADPNWGGCIVNISTDGSTYVPIGTISQAARMGVLTANLASSSAEPDSTNTLAVSLAESAGTLVNASSGATAEAGATLVLVGTEMIGPETATLTGANAYNLTTLYRALFGTAGASHASGAAFARLDNSIFYYQLPAAYVGVTLYFKFQSFNIWGNALQDISTTTAYTYSPTGAGFGGGSGGVPTVPTGLAASASSTSVTLSWSANPSTDNVTDYKVYRAAGTGASFGSASLVATVTALTWTDTGLSTGTGYTYFLEAVNAIGSSSATSGVNATTTTPSSSGIGGASFTAQDISTKPTSKVISRFCSPYAWTLPSGAADCEGRVDTAPTATVTFSLLKNGSSIGTVSWASGSNTPTFSVSTSVSFSVGDYLDLETPSNLNGMAGAFGLSIIGTRP